MSIAELVKESDIAFENFQNKKQEFVNNEKLEMGMESSQKLNIPFQENYYEIQMRKSKLESYGYKEMSINDISKELFGNVLKIKNVKDRIRFRGGFSWETHDYGIKNGTTDIKLSLYKQPKIPSTSSGHLSRKYACYSYDAYEIFGLNRSLQNKNITDEQKSIIQKRINDKKEEVRIEQEQEKQRLAKELISYTGYCDKISFIGRTGLFRTKTFGYISSPSCLNQPIPSELLARMEDLARSGLINCFIAAGYEKAFTFETPVKVEPIDPIILAVIDDGFGVVSPLNLNTHMFFVGKYN